jgi:ribokinase
VSDELLAQVTVLTPNETEAEFLTGVALGSDVASDSWAEGVARKLLSRGSQAIIVTMGARGAFLASRSGQSLIPTYPVTVVDTTAAGDAFNGALAVALAEGKELEDAVNTANAAGALATTRAGAQPSLAWREEIDSMARHELRHGPR